MSRETFDYSAHNLAGGKTQSTTTLGPRKVSRDGLIIPPPPPEGSYVTKSGDAVWLDMDVVPRGAVIHDLRTFMRMRRAARRGRLYEIITPAVPDVVDATPPWDWWVTVARHQNAPPAWWPTA